MSFVLDASMALSWCFQDEGSSKTIFLLEALETKAAYVPAIWSLEVGNALLVAERKKRITYAVIIEFFSLLNNLNIYVDEHSTFKYLHEIFSLAHAEGLTTYDAAYLEIAMRLGLPLATKDVQLAKAAKKLGVNIL